ncbi:unnamed protein product [Linum tenue]|uniref:WRKY domain-containing protein n=2 Tax=Linum tenue TaxID=586396 RepID=A0AAV0Q719_9ROSI|nr:unnamed protein product [Linum tenue]
MYGYVSGFHTSFEGTLPLVTLLIANCLKAQVQLGLPNMGGVDENIAIIGEWAPPTPSPRAFFSSILAEEAMSARGAGSDQPGESNARMDGFFLGTTRGLMKTAGKRDVAAAAQSDVTQLTDHFSSPFNDHKVTSSSSRGGLVERMAARAGFNAPKLNTENMRATTTTDLSLNAEVRSPYLTIPPGLSPTSLLDSPVFVNSLAQPSPTTGKFSFFPNGNGKSSNMMSDPAYRNKDNYFEGINSSSFAFKTVPEMSPSFFTGSATKATPVTLPQQSFPSIEVSMQSENSLHSHVEQHANKFLPPQNKSSLHLATDFSKLDSDQRENYGKAIATSDAIGGSSAAAHSSPLLDDQDDEGGDQRVSGDSSLVGAPAEDGYNWRKYGQKQVKGSEYPRSYYKCTNQNCPVKKKVERSHEGHITEIIYKGAHNHPKPQLNRRATIGSLNPLADMALENPGNDNIEVTSSASAVAAEFGNQNPGAHFESSEAVDASSTFSNDEDEDDRATHNSVGNDGEGDESESKRRKIEAYPADMSGATRAIREPRVVVQTTSEVDILDDGYRWRKYGQKVVKGNPNPRSYYKCTNAGCTVRKHVERASHDLKSVITTYEGKHNHDVPAARNSSHASAASAPSSQAGHIPRPEAPQVHNNMNRGGFDSRQTAGPYGSFSLPGRQQQQQQQNGFSFGMGQPGLANLAMMMPSSVHHPYLAAAQQQRSYSEMGFMLPKGEPKSEPMSEPSLNMSNNAALYQQIMSRLPLGPQM